MAHKWKDNEKVEIDPTKYVKGKGTRKYIKARQCATVYKKGGRAGLRCSWYAIEGSLYCKKHQGGTGVVQAPEHAEAHKQGARNWWARMKKIEAENPGFLRAFFNHQTGEAWHRSHDKDKQPMLKTEDKTILRAHKAITNEIAALPAVPDKPFEQLEPHEQLTVITGQSLQVVHEILSFPLTDDEGNPDLKTASMVKDTALRALAVRVKVDRNALTARKIDRMAEILQKLKAPGDGAKLIEG